MHFDEVYHARTAAEFLQDWRYGISHYIYEWTHPHLAKYAMAGGIVLFAGHDTQATSDLGVPVRDAAIEPRRPGPVIHDRPGRRSGVGRDGLGADRLRPAHPQAGRLVDRGRRGRRGLRQRPQPALRGHRRRGAAGPRPGQPRRAGRGRRSTRSSSPSSSPRSTARSAGWRRSTTARTSPRSSPAAPSRSSTPTRAPRRGAWSCRVPSTWPPRAAPQAIVGAPAQVDDPAAVAAELASILGGDAASFEDRLADTAQDTVVVAPVPTGDVRATLQTAIDDGSLPGSRWTPWPQLAVAGTDGVTLLTGGGVDRRDGRPRRGRATGLALASQHRRRHAALRHHHRRVDGRAAAGRRRGDGGVGREGAHGPRHAADARARHARRVRLGGRDGRGPRARRRTAPASTVYVVEPHGKSVFADQDVPFAADRLGARPQPRLPDGEPRPDPRVRRRRRDGVARRRRLRVRLAAARACSWGRVTVGLLFLLTRILFRRRSIAVLVALFALLDGMFFVQSRIAMNDVYVGRVHPGRLLRVRLAVDQARAATLGVLDADADDRPVPGPRARVEVGGGLRDRRAGHPDPRPLRARPAAPDRRDDRAHRRARLDGDGRAARAARRPAT